MKILDKIKRKRDGKTPLINKIWAKVIAFILAVICPVISAFCVFSAVEMCRQNLYTTPKDDYLYSAYNGTASNTTDTLVQLLLNNKTAEAENFCKTHNISEFTLLDDKANALWSYSFDFKSEVFTYNQKQKWDIKNTNFKITKKIKKNIKYATSRISVPVIPIYNDGFKFVYNMVNIAYANLYLIYFYALVSAVLFISCVVFLLCSAGHKKGFEKVQPSWGYKIPFDLTTAVSALFLILNIKALAPEASNNFMLYALGIGVEFLIIVLSWLMSFATRIKLGKWWKNTLIFRFLKILKKLCLSVNKIPVIWKTALLLTVISLVEFIFLCTFYFNSNIFLLWFFEKLVIVPFTLYVAYNMKKLLFAGRALAYGEQNYNIDVSKFHGDFKVHAENLNSISLGINRAVNEQMKSERMKTELITNVSHDIKTPLTSIINYAELIGKEKTDNKKIDEYSEVLTRQSTRLKRLIEDLVEASKASSGNLDINLSPCNADIIFTQISGEYEENLKKADLSLVIDKPSYPIPIMADGRRLWRVFDNLMSNICKYSQPSTRVYLSLEKKGNEAVISFKNTSREPLNINPNELFERFVRADKSRNSDGNGLGLSIAKDLTQLQNGTLEIFIDGDLFKAVLTFPILN